MTTPAHPAKTALSLVPAKPGVSPGLDRDLPPIPTFAVERAVARALDEDMGETGDITSVSALPDNPHVEAAIVARADGRLAGLEVARATFALIDPDVVLASDLRDGASFTRGTTLATITGPAQSVFSGERVALNFLQRLCGIATLTAAYVAAVDDAMTRVAGTRKTTPGLRALERHAIRCGGGADHRFGLADAILIKDNHIAAAGGVGPALTAVRARAGHMAHVSVELDGLDQLNEALRYSPDVILLDNFSLDDLREGVRRVGARAIVEASGGVTLKTIADIAATGVDVISVGALTHSAPSLDIGLDMG